MSNKTSNHTSVKHEIISKTNANILLAISLTTFLVVFCIFAARALFSQSAYYNRVITEKKKALDQIEANEEPLASLTKSYDSFKNSSINVIGGNPEGTGPMDGNNIKIIEDSLPSSYDFPALTSSFEKILKETGVEIKSIGGKEDSSLSQQNVPTGEATGLEVPYTISFSGPEDKTKELLKNLERSIRPINVNSIQIQISGNNMDSVVNLKTYYTQESAFILGTKEIE